LDFAGSSGTDIMAAASGTVVSTGWEGSYGNQVVIDHGNGYQTTYNHMSGIGVRAGQKVQTGDHIGDMGSTGNSTGTHLHFEVTHNGKFMDPESWLGW
jgi:murein DD-endopeptidase MepM/ murein hydrolase activator NlpD